MKKCLLLYSSGLDSILAKKILEKQGIKVDTINFCSYFFDGKKDFSKEHLKVIKNPEYGRGQGMNPCRDCHLLMLKTAKKEKGYDFIATGEVVGQRPFSQNKDILLLLDKRAGLTGMVLRPLSAKLLPETIPEKKGWVNREDLFDISGKTRKKQIELAKKFKIKKYPSPAGGCVLTDKNYSKLLKKLFELKPKCDGSDCLILRQGRVFFESSLFVITRDEQEGKDIKKYFKKGDIVLEPSNFSGPTTLIRKLRRRISENDIKKAEKYLLKFSKNIPDKKIIKQYKI